MFIQKWGKEGIEESKKKKKRVHYCYHSTLGKITRSWNYMKHLIYTRKIYINEGYKVLWAMDPSGQAVSDTCEWRGGGMGRSGMVVGSWQCHHGDMLQTRASDRALACHEQPTTQRQGRVPLWVCHIRTNRATLPIFYPPLLLPIHAHTHAHTHTGAPPLPVTIKMVKWDAVSNTKRPRPSQKVGRLRRNLRR